MVSSGLRLGEYVIVRRVAVGATSDVYQGRHVVSGEPVAVKVLSSEWCVHAEVVARFLNEARVLQELRHPHLVRALASGVLPDGPPFMILEWLPVDLHQALTGGGGRLAARHCEHIVRQLADALAMLHARGFVHRDLKPANVLLSRKDLDAWEVKLADLGLAKRVSGVGAPVSAFPVSTAGGALLGTWDYMAPEQWIRSKDVDGKADVYALGVLWFQLLAGRLPFLSGEQKDLMYHHLLEPPPLELLDGLVPAPTRTWVGRMLSKKSSERPTMKDVLALLSTAGG